MDKPSVPNDNPLTTAEMMAAYRAEQQQPQDEAKLGWLYLGFIAVCFIALLALAWVTLDDDDSVGGLGVEPLDQTADQIEGTVPTSAVPEDAQEETETDADTETEVDEPASVEDVQADITALLEGTTILFDANEATISSGAGVIVEVADAIRDTDLNLRVEGYTDSVGEAEDNLELSQERAETVQAALVEQGIAASRIETEGFGEAEAVQENPTDAQREADRRIEIVVVEG